MSEEIATEKGDNWSVLFFQCPVKEIQQVLVNLFEYLKSVEATKIPHFILREFAISQSVGISLRMLRKQEHAEMVDNKLTQFFERHRLYYEKDPINNRHGWIQRGSVSSQWDYKHCESLHLLSKLIVFLAENNIFITSYRCHMAHYAVNMLILQEATLSGSGQVYFLDLVDNEALPFKTIKLSVK